MMASAPMPLALAVNRAKSAGATVWEVDTGAAAPRNTAKAWYGREGGAERTSTESVGGYLTSMKEV